MIAETIIHVVTLLLIVLGGALAVWFKDLLSSIIAPPRDAGSTAPRRGAPVPGRYPVASVGTGR